MIARGEVESPRGPGAKRLTAFMEDRRGVGHDGRKPSPACFQTEIEIFETKEVFLLQNADGVEDLALDEHQTAAHSVHRSAGRRFGINQANAMATMPHPSGQWRIRHADRCDPVRLRANHHDGTCDSRGWRGVKTSFEAVERVWRHDDIAV